MVAGYLGLKNLEHTFITDVNVGKEGVALQCSVWLAFVEAYWVLLGVWAGNLARNVLNNNLRDFCNVATCRKSLACWAFEAWVAASVACCLGETAGTNDASSWARDNNTVMVVSYR